MDWLSPFQVQDSRQHIVLKSVFQGFEILDNLKLAQGIRFDLKEQIADLQSDLRKIAVQNLLLSEENRSLRIQLKTLGERSNSKD